MAKPCTSCKRIRKAENRCLQKLCHGGFRASRSARAPQCRQRAAQCRAATQDAPDVPADAPAGAIGDQLLAVDAPGSKYGPDGKVEKVCCA